MNKDVFGWIAPIIFVGCSVLFGYTCFIQGSLPYVWGISIKTNEYDLHYFSKMMSMVLIAIVMLIYLILHLMRKTVNARMLLVVALIGTIFLLSYLGSEESIREITILGYDHRYEGLLTWCAYLVFFLWILEFVSSVRVVKTVVLTIGVFYGICAIIGVGQHFGFDLLRTTFYRALMSPIWDWKYTLALMPIDFGRMSYSTLANPNHLSFLFSMLLPAGTYYVLVAKKERQVNYFIWGIFFLCLLGSKSIGGLFGFGMSAVTALFFGWRTIFARSARFWKICAVALICFIPSLTEIISDLIYIVPSEETKGVGHYNEIKRVENGIVFAQNGRSVIMSYDVEDRKLSFQSGGQQVDYHSNNKEITLEYPFHTFVFHDLEDDLFGYSIGNRKVNLTYKNGDYFVVNQYGMLISTEDVEASEVFVNERFGSGRGYIWSRALPLIKDTILIGKGPDSFTYYFPQDDILGKSTGLGNPYIIVDKPHSTYIQIAHSFGVIFAIFFFGTFIAYVVYAMRLTRLKEPSVIENYIIAIGFSMIAFLVSALFYDLSVHVTPTVIFMLGIGIVLLRLRKEEQQAKDVETAEMALELEG